MSDDLFPLDDPAPSARQLYERAEALVDQGDYGAARTLYEQALTIHEELSGPEHPATARCLHALARVLMEQGEYPEAEERVGRALAIRQQVLGAEHPDTAEALATLGGILFDRGEFERGLSLVEQAYRLQERLLGESDPATIESMRNLGLMKAYRGNRREAEKLLLRALSLCERLTAAQDGLLARVMNGLGIFWGGDRESYDRARAMHERALAINERVLGAEHPHTARSLNNLAALLANMEDYEAARPLLQRSLALHERLLGPAHPGIAFVLVNLADSYSLQGNLTAARPLLERALIIRERAYGPRHPETLRTLRKLVTVLGALCEQGDEEALFAAMPLYQCLMGLEAAAGLLDPQDLNMPGAHQSPARAAEQLHQLVARLEAELDAPPLSAADQADLQAVHRLVEQATRLREEGEPAKAEALLEEALARQERVLGEYHLDHVALLDQLSRVKAVNGRYSALLPLMQWRADIYIELLGAGHPNTLAALTELMTRYVDEYGPAAAQPLQQQISHLMEDALGAEDPAVQMIHHLFEAMQELSVEESDEDLWDLSKSEQREAALAALPPERVAILEGIDRINWHALGHAYGPADDVPNLLRMLLSDDEEVREEAWEELYQTIWHQGTVYEATAFVVPFLLRMLVQEGPPGKDELLYLLATIADGNSYLAAHASSEQRREEWEAILAREGRELERELQKELDRVEASNRAVGEGLPIYLELLSHPEAELRHLSLYVLSRLRSRSADVSAHLRALLPSLEDAELRTGVVRALHELMGEEPEARQFFADLLQQAENEKIELIAAAALAARAREQSPERAVTVLLAALQSLAEEGADDLIPEERHYPLWIGSVPGVVDALLQLDRPRATSALLWGLPMVQDGQTALEVAGLLLDLVFNDGQIQERPGESFFGAPTTGGRHPGGDARPKREPSSLDETERAVLTAIVAHDPLWEGDHNLLLRYGLPGSRDALRAFLT